MAQEYITRIEFSRVENDEECFDYWASVAENEDEDEIRELLCFPDDEWMEVLESWCDEDCGGFLLLTKGTIPDLMEHYSDPINLIVIQSDEFEDASKPYPDEPDELQRIDGRSFVLQTTYKAYEDDEFEAAYRYIFPKDEKEHHEMFLMGWNGNAPMPGSKVYKPFFNQNRIDDSYFYEDEDDFPVLPDVYEWIKKYDKVPFKSLFS